MFFKILFRILLATIKPIINLILSMQLYSTVKKTKTLCIGIKLFTYIITKVAGNKMKTIIGTIWRCLIVISLLFCSRAIQRNYYITVTWGRSAMRETFLTSRTNKVLLHSCFVTRRNGDIIKTIYGEHSWWIK